MFTPGEKEAICKAVVRASQQASLMENLGERFLLPFLLNPTVGSRSGRHSLLLSPGCQTGSGTAPWMRTLLYSISPPSVKVLKQ